jgi:hypothetical protein
MVGDCCARAEEVTRRTRVPKCGGPLPRAGLCDVSWDTCCREPHRSTPDEGACDSVHTTSGDLGPDQPMFASEHGPIARDARRCGARMAERIIERYGLCITDEQVKEAAAEVTGEVLQLVRAMWKSGLPANLGRRVHQRMSGERPRAHGVSEARGCAGPLRPVPSCYLRQG